MLYSVGYVVSSAEDSRCDAQRFPVDFFRLR